MLELGLQATRDLDAAVAVAPKRFLSQRDVPGVPRSAIPLLTKHQVGLITVGVNGASMYPRVPKIFRWVDPVSSEALVAMWHPRGYGGYSVGEAVMVHEFDEALVTDWNADNAGPADADHYIDVFEKVQHDFPDAAVVASTFDDWLEALERGGVTEMLPTLEHEIGDSWVYGVPSDPKKVARARAIDRALVGYFEAGGTSDAPLRNFSRLAIKNCEHTWGRDVKRNLDDDASWTNLLFESARGAPGFGVLEASWWEQRQWGFEWPLAALPSAHPLRELIRKEVDGIEQPVPYEGLADERSLRADGFVPLADPAQPSTCGSISIGFDSSSGAINHLADLAATPPVQWASADRPLFGLRYRTYSQQEFLQFQNNYANETDPPSWFRKDFGKPNMSTSVNATWHAARASSVWRRTQAAAGTTTFLVRSVVVDDAGSHATAHEQYGAPQYLVTQLVVRHAAPGDIVTTTSNHANAGHTAPIPERVQVTLWTVNKTATRLPESFFVSFTPSGNGTWEMHKLGQWQPAQADVVAGGSKHLHGVSTGGGVRFVQTALGREGSRIAKQPALSIEMVDAPVINLGEPLGFPIACTALPDPWAVEPDLATFGASSMLWNNLWGTNYIQWYPFRKNYTDVPGEENFISRYNLRF